MKALYVTSNQNSAGKTTFCSAFGSFLQAESQKIVVIKPVSISNRGDQDTDAEFYSSIFKGTSKKLSSIQMSQSSISKVAQKKQQEIVQSIKDDVASLRKAGLSVVVEGLPTHDENGDQITLTQEIVKALDCNVISITTFNPQAEKHASELVSLFPKEVKGTIINNISRYKNHHVNNELIPSIEGAGVRVLASIPEHRYLMAKTVLELSKRYPNDFKGLIIESGIADEDPLFKLIVKIFVGKNKSSMNFLSVSSASTNQIFSLN